MKHGEICLGAFPFGDAPGMKSRPVLVLSPVTGPSAEVLVASISSVIPDQLLATDFMLDPLRTLIVKAISRRGQFSGCTSWRRFIAPVCLAVWASCPQIGLLI